MRDGPGRRALKRVARAWFELELSLRRTLRRKRGRELYRLGGDCRRCARCCEAPGIQVGRLVWYLPTLRAAFLWWQSRLNGFELVSRRAAERVFVFRCSHFDWETRACDSYGSRPGICRDYPRALLEQPNPELLPGCGYRPVTLRARALAAALERQPLSPQQRDKLRKGLFLEG